MKKSNIVIITLLIIVLFSFSFSSIAQNDEPYRRTKFVNKKHIKDFFFSGISVTSWAEVWGSPVFAYEYSTIGGFKFSRPVNTTLVSLLKVAKEYRCDLIQYDEMISLSVNAPIGLSFNVTSGDFYKAGLFAAHLPAYLMLNFFRNSSKTRIDKYGFNVGVGYHYFYFPLQSQNKNVYDMGYVVNQGMKVLRFGIVHAQNDKMDHAIDFKIGLEAKRYLYDADFDNQQKTLANFYYSLSYVFMLK